MNAESGFRGVPTTVKSRLGCKRSPVQIRSRRLARTSKSRQRLREPPLAGFELLHGRFTLSRLHAASSALWSLRRADGASGSGRRRVQCHGGANERLERLFINLVALMEIDGTPGVAFEAGVEEACRVRVLRALCESYLHY